MFLSLWNFGYSIFVANFFSQFVVVYDNFFPFVTIIIYIYNMRMDMIDLIQLLVLLN